MSAFFLVAFVLSLIATAAALRLNWMAWRSLKWPEVPAELVQADVEEHCDEGCAQRLAIQYAYVVGGRRYVGDKAWLVDVGSPDRRRHDRALARIRARQRQADGLKVRVDPDNPTQAVIFPGLSFGGALALAITLTVSTIFGALALASLAR